MFEIEEISQMTVSLVVISFMIIGCEDLSKEHTFSILRVTEFGSGGRRRLRSPSGWSSRFIRNVRAYPTQRNNTQHYRLNTHHEGLERYVKGLYLANVSQHCIYWKSGAACIRLLYSVISTWFSEFGCRACAEKLDTNNHMCAHFVQLESSSPKNWWVKWKKQPRRQGDCMITSGTFLASKLMILEYGKQILTPKTVAFTYDERNVQVFETWWSFASILLSGKRSASGGTILEHIDNSRAVTVP